MKIEKTIMILVVFTFLIAIFFFGKWAWNVWPRYEIQRKTRPFTVYLVGKGGEVLEVEDEVYISEVRDGYVFNKVNDTEFNPIGIVIEVKDKVKVRQYSIQ